VDVGVDVNVDVGRLWQPRGLQLLYWMELAKCSAKGWHSFRVEPRLKMFPALAD
jgi:hypothetical protein